MQVDRREIQEGLALPGLTASILAQALQISDARGQTEAIGIFHRRIRKSAASGSGIGSELFLNS